MSDQDRPDGLPFSAVVGQEQAKLALLLGAVDRRIGGVLLRGAKGSAKSTLVRGLAALLPGHAPFVELPIGATEDRVIGTLDITEALTGGHQRFQPGLLAAADGGVLYVDEINLLPDHLVDVLLDVAATGINRVEREGISHSHPSRFVLVGSMNPEEGELRPQLLDRFGLAVEVAGSEGAERVAALKQRLALDRSGPEVRAAFAPAETELSRRLAVAVPGQVPDSLIEAVAALCSEAGAEGLRADLAICRSAAALAGWEGRALAEPHDVRRVAAMALAHRARRDPFDPVGVDGDRLDEALDRHLPDPPPPSDGPSQEAEGRSRDDPSDGPGDEPAGNEPAGAGGPETPVSPGETLRPPTATARPVGWAEAAPGRHQFVSAGRGRVVGDRTPQGPVGALAVGATVRRAAERRAASLGPDSGPLVQVGDIREARREQKTSNLVVVAVDSSGSMGAPGRMEAAKGAVIGLLRDAYQRRDLIGMVAFGGDTAEVLLKPTGSVEVARARLTDLRTGGRTPLAAGIAVALDLATAPGRASTHAPVLVVITDGRATSAPHGADPVAAARTAAFEVSRRRVASVVVDIEGLDGSPRLGLAAELAEAMGARHVRLDELTPRAIAEVVTSVTIPGN